ncbi:hypothetical protein [Leptolyngbya sp. GGD]|uniref:hypothetical protein n=1 Tax=Leptolyngbya sp. GGD TaxID=2997907 RepID=UPI00227D1910|nr:hypothetical protein [Leptolyngbya sp. GGD]MCY6494315.1 hypothetical protein [Leptolyngbya sp. GGD]
MLSKIAIDLFTLKSFSQAEKIRSHLDLLTSSNFAPTHWGVNERPNSRRKYSTEEVLFSIDENNTFDGMCLYRKSSPSYTIFYSSGSDTPLIPNALHCSFEKGVTSLDPINLKSIFSLGSLLAAELEVVYGYIWLYWNENEAWKQYMPQSLINSFELAKYGPNPVQARTWFGSYLTQLIGKDVFSQCGVLMRDTSWGGLELDLVPEPWNSSLEEVLAQQKKAMSTLSKTGIFGDYQKFADYAPGESWSPFFGVPPHTQN